MNTNSAKTRVRLGERVAAQGCCAGSGNTAQAEKQARGSSCCQENAAVAPGSSPIRTVSSEWDISDHIGRIRCRISGLRMGYAVTPGLYALGAPGASSDVFVSANYKLSFDLLRRSLNGMSAWILVLDTKGINVWCAAGKGTFGTDELIGRIAESRLGSTVAHRRIIVPQLGAPGIAAHDVQRKTGFRVYYGPVDARDIRAYVEAGYRATEDMRAVRFPIMERLALTPMEIIPAMKKYPYFALLTLLIMGVQPSGITFAGTLSGALPFLAMGLVSILAGAFATPALLPFIPVRSFAVKGWLAGMTMTFAAAELIGINREAGLSLLIFTYVFFPLVGSYIALQFTGATVYTGMSGVRMELKYAIPAYIGAAVVSCGLLAAFKLSQWGVI